MARLGRKGRILKWCGLVMSLLMAVAWAFFIHWTWSHATVRKAGNTTSRYVDAEIGAGCLVYVYDPTERMGRQIESRWDFRRESGVPTAVMWLPSVSLVSGLRLICMPLWIPFLILAVPTGFLWWRDHPRMLHGHCQKCGYNLTGNVSGVYPECGQKADAQPGSKG